MSTLPHAAAAPAPAPSGSAHPSPAKPAHSDHPSVVPKGKFNPRELDWVVIIGLVLLHAAAALAFIPSLFTWSGLVLAGVFAFIATCLGMCVCYHRLLSHRSFRTPKWFEYVLVWCGCLAWQGGPVGWVGTHRLHHKHSDGDHDPHTPQHGFTWAHMTWFMHKYHHGVERRQAATDLLKDRGLRFLDTYAWLPLVTLIAALFGAGYAWGTWVSDLGGLQVGLSWVVWAVALRTVVFFHVTWFVNSASHTWGYQNYKDSGDHSTNLWWLALPSFGEGWHNNHHANPRSAAHGLRWWEFDITYTVIKLLSFVGLASRLNVPPAERRPWKAQNATDGA